MLSQANLVCIFASLIVVTLGLEGALRAFGVHFDASLYSPDPVLGWTLRPGSSGWNVTEGRVFIRINSQGYRDRERTIAKPPNTFRIAVLGDSTTEARQVPLEDTFCSLLERSLASRSAFAGTRVEVLNFGVPGYGTTQELLTLRTRVWSYQPDFILLQMYLGNDLFDNYRKLDYTKPGGRPYYVCKDTCTLDSSFARNHEFQPASIRRHNVLADVMNDSRLLLLVNDVRQVLLATKFQKDASVGRLPGIAADYPSWLAYAKPEHPDLQAAWYVTERVLLMFRDEVRAHHVEFVVVNLPQAMQVDPNPVQRSQFAERYGVSLEYPDEHMGEFAVANDIPFFSISGALGRYALQHHVYVNGFPNTTPGKGHLNSLGHRLAAKMIENIFCGSHKPPA